MITWVEVADSKTYMCRAEFPSSTKTLYSHQYQLVVSEWQCTCSFRFDQLMLMVSCHGVLQRCCRPSVRLSACLCRFLTMFRSLDGGMRASPLQTHSIGDSMVAAHPNSHRRRQRDEVVEFRRVGGVNGPLVPVAARGTRPVWIESGAQSVHMVPGICPH